MVNYTPLKDLLEMYANYLVGIVGVSVGLGYFLARAFYLEHLLEPQNLESFVLNVILVLALIGSLYYFVYKINQYLKLIINYKNDDE